MITNYNITKAGLQQLIVFFIYKILFNFLFKYFFSAFYKQNENDSNWTIYLLLSSHNLNIKNLWTGEWLSFWTLKKLEANKYQINGNIKINTYYYEEGNIQFNLDKDFKSEFSSESEGEDLAKEFFEFIKKSENESQVNLDKLFENLSDQYIKPLRRKLPSKIIFIYKNLKFSLVSGCRMNWNLAHQTIMK